MLLVHLGSEKVQILINGEKYEVARNAIEKEFSSVILALYKKYKFKRLFLIQGPGSFTVIRIGVLLLNSLLMLVDNDIEVFSMSKEQFIVQLTKTIDSIPSKSLLYIGQRKNVRLFDNTSGEHEIIAKKSLEEQEGSFLTDSQDVEELNARFIGLSLHQLDNEELQISIDKTPHAIKLSDLQRGPQTMVQPYYGIKPNVD